MSVLKAAQKYVGIGWAVIPVHFKSKKPVSDGWPEKGIAVDDLSSVFAVQRNIGVLLGAPSGGLVDVDVDAPLAVRLAAEFLPPTPAIFGRVGKPSSHWLYQVNPIPPKTTKFQGPAASGKMITLVEVRSTGGHTVFPPSTHESGEGINWSAGGTPATVDADVLFAAVRKLAAAALLASRWPEKGARNDAALALSGGLLRASWPADDVERFVEAVADAAGDEEHADRAKTGVATAAKMDAGSPTTGWPALAVLVGDKVVDHCRKWLAIHSEAAATIRATQSSQLVDLAQGVELFHDASMAAYARVAHAGHHETHLLTSQGFRDWLARSFHLNYGKVPGSQAIQDALTVLRGKALYEGHERQVFVRVAEANGAIYVDLANGAWEAVEITADGYSVVAEPPVMFRRPRGAAALPYPVGGGSAAELRPFVNVADDGQFALFVGFLMCLLRIGIQYPVLVLNGEQGAAKSTAARIIKELLDPAVAPLQGTPREVGDLMISAKHSWCLAFDNLSWIPDWLSDALCRLSTGGGLNKRQLYTDDEPVIFDVQRPVVLTGIGEVVTKSDLLDRSIGITFPTIGEQSRQDENEFWASFEAARPRIFGALLDAAAHGLRHMADVKLTAKPRMAAAAKWVVAAEPALPWASGTFLAAYRANRETANTTALEASTLYGALTQAVTGTFKGTFTELLKGIDAALGDKAGRRGYPSTAHHLSNSLRRIEPNLKAAGWVVIRADRLVEITAPKKTEAISDDSF